MALQRSIRTLSSAPRKLSQKGSLASSKEFRQQTAFLHGAIIDTIRLAQTSPLWKVRMERKLKGRVPKNPPLGGGSRIRTWVDVSRRIYSPLPLAARAIRHEQVKPYPAQRVARCRVSR